MTTLFNMIMTGKVLGYLILFVTSITACTNFVEINHLNLTKDSIYEPDIWYAFGPFSYDSLKQAPEETFLNRDLNAYGIDESVVTLHDIKTLLDSQVPKALLRGQNITHSLGKIVTNYKDKSSFYLTSIVKSKESQRVWLLLDGSTNCRIWLNQNEIYKVQNKTNSNKLSDKFINVQLNKGNNLFFAKANRKASKTAWGIDLAIVSEKTAREIFAVNYFSDFILNPVCKDSLKIYLGPLDDSKIVISEESGNFKRESLTRKDTSNIFVYNTVRLEEGFYRLGLISGKDTLYSHFYKGDLDLYYTYLKSRYLELMGVKRLTLAPLVERIDYITARTSSSFVYWVKQFKDSLLTKKGYPALQMRTYRSKNGTQRQYLFYCDEELRRKKDIPLVMVVPFEIDCKSLASCWFPDRLDQLLIDARLASSKGFAVCWLFMDGGNYIEKAAVFEFESILTQLSTDFQNINTKGVYLTGDCVGAKRAILLAGSVPEKIKAIALKSPIPNTDYGDSFESISSVPVCIRHGMYDIEIPVDKMRSFVNSLYTKLDNLQYIEEAEGHLSFRKDSRKYAFEFFNQCERMIYNEGGK